MGYSPQGLKELDSTKVTEDRARYRTLQVGLSGKESACQVGDLGSIPGILQARTLEWVAISFSNA